MATAVQTAQSGQLARAESMLAPDAENRLGEAERARIEEIKQGLDISSAPSVLNFGGASEKRMADFADSVLEQVMSKDTGPIHEKLSEIKLIASGLSPEKLKQQKGFIARLFFSLKREIAKFSDRFKTARAQVDGIAANLEDQIHQLNLGLIMLDKLFEQNQQNFQELGLHIVAGKEMLAHYRDEVLPGLQAEAQLKKDDPDGMVLGQQARDMQAAIDRLDRKLLNLEKSRTIAFATMPTIRQVQQTGIMLVEELKMALTHAIPAWKNAMLINIEQLRQRHGLETMQAMTDFTNQQLSSMMDQLDANATAIHQQSNRGVADADVIAESISKLIHTLDKVETMEKEARVAREQSRQTLAKAEADLRAYQAGDGVPAAA